MKTDCETDGSFYSTRKHGSQDPLFPPQLPGDTTAPHPHQPGKLLSCFSGFKCSLFYIKPQVCPLVPHIAEASVHVSTFLGDHIASLFTISRVFFWSYLHLDIIWVTLTQRLLLSFRLDRNNLETQWEETHIIVICNGDWKWRHICCCHVAGSNLLSTHEPGDELMSTWSKIATTLIMFCSILWPKYLQQQKYLVQVMECWRLVITIRALYFTQNLGPHIQCQCSMTKLDFWMIILIT